MNDSAPKWPLKLSREQKQAAKQREKIFEAELKAQAKGSGWRYARGSIFRQDGEWFISNLPSLAWERGVIVRLRCKPMALDSLFWEIEGLEENNKLPLSFREQGAWVLRPAPIEEYLDAENSNPADLALKVLRWSDEWLQNHLPSLSVTKMLSDLGDTNELSGHYRSIAVCLTILQGNLKEASRLTGIEGNDINSILREDGGFTTTNHDGSHTTFLDKASSWVTAKRREQLKTV